MVAAKHGCTKCYEIKCITAVLLKFTPQVIVGKYGTSSVSSKLMNW